MQEEQVVVGSAEDDDNPKPELDVAVHDENIILADHTGVVGSDGSSSGGEHNGFGVVQEALEAVFGYGSGASNQQQQQQQPQQRFERPEEEEVDDFVVDDDDDDVDGNEELSDNNQQSSGGKNGDVPPPPLQEQDPSDYDVWMGVLSSTPLRFFGRIVSLPDVGVYRVTDQVEDDEEEL